jgi:hypothetical protein
MQLKIKDVPNVQKREKEDEMEIEYDKWNTVQ